MRLLLEGPRIEPLLARVRAEHGPEARIVHAERVRTGGVAGFFAREHFEVTVEINDTAVDLANPDEAVIDRAPVDIAAQPAVADAGTGEPPATPLDRLLAAADAAERQAAVPDVQPHRPLSTEGKAFEDVLRSLQQVDADQPVPGTEQPRPEGVPPTLRDRVAAAGLPLELVGHLPQDAGPTELLDVLRRLPAAPAHPARAGHVVAVVGDRRDAVATARRIADRLRLDPDAVVVFGRTSASIAAVAAGMAKPTGPVRASTDQARQASAAARLADVPTVVAVESGPDSDQLDWTRQVLRGLIPDQVVACVDATRKPADIGSWLAGWCPEGTAVDALSVHRTECSSDPATVLALGVPVADVDGQPSSPATWLALLLARAHPATDDLAACQEAR